MAKGDIYRIYDETVSDDATVAIQPAAGKECQIENIYWGTTAGTDASKIEIYRYENSTAYKIADYGGWTALGYAPNSIVVRFYVTNASYLIVKNVSGGEMTFVGADGVERKPAT